MAFVGSSVGYTVAGTFPLPVFPDVGGNCNPITPYSHLQCSGTGTIAFDNNPSAVMSMPASPVVLAIPPAARKIITTGTPNIILGTMD
jgi:hypothetical protein